MSLSQKYQGKVLVPWYNSSEWKYVCEILCDKRECEYSKVLEILKIWKIRATLLSAGVEGTLLILEALMQNKDSLSDEQIIQVYSVSLLRFLNLTAANNEKQGSFNQTVTKNEIPKWLIDIRHDIAHNNKLPSKSILELSMKQCLEWTVQKYWSSQNNLICDYVIKQNPQDIQITELLGTYCELKINLYYNRDINRNNEILFKKINYFVTKRHNKSSTDYYGMLDILEEMLKQSLGSLECKNSTEDIASILASETGLLGIVSKNDFENLENLPISFKEIWTNILNILIDNEYLFIILKKLHDITNDLLINDKIKKACSLWLKEVFQSLLKLKIQHTRVPNYSNKTIKDFIVSLEDTVFLNLNLTCLSLFDSKMFEHVVLGSANIYSLSYLIYLLCFNDNSEDGVKGTIQLVKSMIECDQHRYMNSMDHQFGSVDQILDLIESDCEMDFEETSTTDTTIKISDDNGLIKKWAVVKNKLDYEGCPLGILPHQDRTKNPCILFI